jgi:hypothetical protein
MNNAKTRKFEGLLHSEPVYLNLKSTTEWGVKKWYVNPLDLKQAKEKAINDLRRKIAIHKKMGFVPFGKYITMDSTMVKE